LSGTDPCPDIVDTTTPLIAAAVREAVRLSRARELTCTTGPPTAPLRLASVDR